MSTLDADVHVCAVWVCALGRADRNNTLEQVLLYPRDDVTRFVERLAVDE